MTMKKRYITPSINEIDITLSSIIATSDSMQYADENSGHGVADAPEMEVWD